MDLSCRCMGSDHRTECDKQATGEDGLCDNCRRHDCENTPVAHFLEQIDELHRRELTPEQYQVEFDQILKDYAAECEAKGVAP